MSEADDPIPDDDVVITAPADQQAGVWANRAAINESDNAFDLSLTISPRAGPAPSMPGASLGPGKLSAGSAMRIYEYDATEHEVLPISDPIIASS